MSARVLIVDDLFPNVKLLETKLGLEYFDTLAAMNGPDAIAICEKGLCDLVLLDVMMPEIDGIATLEMLRSHPTTQDIPVILLTAMGYTSDQSWLTELGVKGEIRKPFRPLKLAEQVAEVLAAD